jgi:DNA polymerase III epsilon subunit-like protein
VLLDTLVKPNVPVEPGARAVHGISDEQLAAAPGWASVYPKLRRVCRGRKLIMYNAAFDLRALKTTCELSSVEWKGLGRSGECLMEMYAQFEVTGRIITRVTVISLCPAATILLWATAGRC